MLSKLLLLAGVVLGTLVVAPAALADCGLPDSGPIWADFAGHGAPIPAKPGMVLAAESGTDLPAKWREAGAATVLFDLNFRNRVGTTTKPADPSLIEPRAKRFFDYAVAVTGCPDPVVAEDELAGAQTPTPWSTTNAQYRQNVLDFLTDLSNLGARPLLSIPNPPFTASEDAKLWWQQVSKVAILLRQVYFTSPNAAGLYKLGPVAASRTMRQGMRGLVDHLTQIGIPSWRVALELQFTPSTRANLQPTSAWLEIVKLEALAAKEVVKEFRLPQVWSWGWANFGPATVDPDKPVAACVWIWVHSPSLCDAPRVAPPGFDVSLSEGQLDVPPGVRCVFSDGEILRNAVARMTALTGDAGYAASVLLEQEVLHAEEPVQPDEVASAERAVIQASFGGSRTRYWAALAHAHLTIADARAIIAARLERDEVEARFRPRPPTAAQISDFRVTYAAQPVRLVQASAPAPWLGGASRGWAIATLSPTEVFSLDGGGEVDTPDGPFDVTPLGEPQPLALLPAAQAEAAARAALELLERGAMYRDWLRAQEEQRLQSASCAGDRLPVPLATDLSPFVPFLLPS